MTSYSFSDGLRHIDNRMDYRYGRVLEAIGDLIHEVNEYMAPFETMHDLGDEIEIEEVRVDEVPFITHLLGLAYVGCQTYITQVESEVKRFHQEAGARSITLGTTTGKKRGILRHGFTPTPEDQYSTVQVLNALANYYKHLESWPRDWTKLDGNQRETADIVEAVGGSSRSLADLLTASEYLDNDSYDDMTKFEEHLAQWRERITHDYKEELQRYNLL